MQVPIPVDDSLVHLITFLLGPGVLGGLGVRWWFQRRNGNNYAKQKDVDRIEGCLKDEVAMCSDIKRIESILKDIARQSDIQGLKGLLAERMKSTDQRFEDAREWIKFVEKKGDDAIKEQVSISYRLGICEGALRERKQ